MNQQTWNNRMTLLNQQRENGELEEEEYQKVLKGLYKELNRRKAMAETEDERRKRATKELAYAAFKVAIANEIGQPDLIQEAMAETAEKLVVAAYELGLGNWVVT